MPINFKPASQNGAVPPTPAKYKQSKLGLIASTTTSVLGQPIIVKALSDAAYYKTTPVTLYAFNPGTNQTIVTTSSFIDTVQAPFVLNNLPDGQWQLWAEWPGDGPFVAKSTQANLINLTINTAVNTGGRLSLTSSPASGSLVAGEGTATFLATITNTTILLNGNLLFYDGNQQIGQAPLVQNHASLSTDSLTAGTHNITVQWPGGLIGGTKYQGFSTSTNYAISSGTVSGTALNLTVSPNHGVFQEGYITLTASLINGATNYPGSVVFYRNGIELYTAPVVGTTATYTYRNFEAVGSTEFKALWDGNQAGHPRFIPVASSTASWTVVARETPSRLSLSVVPNPSVSTAPTYFTATFHQLTGEPLVPGEVIFYSDDLVVGRAPIINDVATTSSYVMTGTHAVYAYYAGSADEPKFYSTRSETISLPVLFGYILDLNLNITSPRYKNNNITFTASVNTTTTLTNNVVFYANGQSIGSGAFNNLNTATLTTSFNNTGSYVITATWPGGQMSNNKFYLASTTSSNITVDYGYLLDQPLNLTITRPRVVDNNITFTASVNTTTTLTNNVVFYANGQSIGSGAFNSRNTATLTTSFVNTGSYVITATWPGGQMSNGKYYQPSISSATNINVNAHTTLELLTNTFVYYNDSTESITTNTYSTATINFIYNNYFNISPTGTLSLYDGATLLGSTTVTSTTNYIRWNPGQFNQIDAGTKTLRLVYSGDTNFISTETSTSWIAKTKITPRLGTVNFNKNGIVYAGENLTITAVKDSTDLYTGVIDFVSDAHGFIGTGTLSGNTASLTFNPIGGNDIIHANYHTNQYYESSTIANSNIQVPRISLAYPSIIQFGTRSLSPTNTSTNLQVNINLSRQYNLVGRYPNDSGGVIHTNPDALTLSNPYPYDGTPPPIGGRIAWWLTTVAAYASQGQGDTGSYGASARWSVDGQIKNVRIGHIGNANQAIDIKYLGDNYPSMPNSYMSSPKNQGVAGYENYPWFVPVITSTVTNGFSSIQLTGPQILNAISPYAYALDASNKPYGLGQFTVTSLSAYLSWYYLNDENYTGDLFEMPPNSFYYDGINLNFISFVHAYNITILA